MLPIGMQTSPSKHLFCVTGQPGVGKTTLIMKVLERVKDAFPELKIQGFYTRETRQAGERVGFEVVTVNGQKGVLASSGAGGFCTMMFTVRCMAECCSWYLANNILLHCLRHQEHIDAFLW